MTFNFPAQFTQGDDLAWFEELTDYDPNVDTLALFLRGPSSLDLTGVANGGQWDFTISSAQSLALNPGDYQGQYVIFINSTQRKALGIVKTHICPSFEAATDLDFRSPDQIELDNITAAINALVSGKVAEYYVGDRRCRYHDLDSLFKRQEYLRQRVNLANNRGFVGGRNVGATYCG